MKKRTQRHTSGPRKFGPRTVYERDALGTWRVSSLVRRIVAAAAERTGKSEGDAVEQILRDWGPKLARDDFPQDNQDSVSA